MADITTTIAPGQPMEKLVITSGADSGQAALTVTFSTTSVYTSKELVIRALQETIQFLEGWTFPPTARS